MYSIVKRTFDVNQQIKMVMKHMDMSYIFKWKIVRNYPFIKNQLSSVSDLLYHTQSQLWINDGNVRCQANIKILSQLIV